MIWNTNLRHIRKNNKADAESRKKFLKMLPFCLLLILLGTAITGCKATVFQNNSDVHNSADRKLKVVSTIFPQYDFVRQIAGDKVDLKMLLKPGEESHSYEPTPQDIIAIQNCDVFLYVGGENDEWVEDILSSIDEENIKILRLVDCVDTVEEEHVEGMKEERHGHGEGEQHKEDEHSEGEVDEHVWTSPQNAIEIVDNITELLCREDSSNAELYRKNAKIYDTKLNKLDEDFLNVTEQSTNNTLVFGDRFPFRYFADAYDLEYYAAFSGCASDTEPSAATMAFLINKVKDDNLPVVLKMDLSNDNIAKAIAEATGAKVKVFYSCHNITAKQFQEGVTYLSMMEKNAETLKEALADGTD
ncbi:zinc transport system substrate-binding protein [Muricomes intestini]|uniref:Zinc transport system substrate-binding protein n=3 Tax=Muricomes intestini TaxID=1796634 RepID=A0A4R3JZK4_9FIRM|nr:zinc transport system substrate-binding protein [Muricomes intestini]